MSSDPPSGGPSATPEREEPGREPTPAPEPGRADVVSALGAPLLEALERHLPGTRRHAESTSGSAFAAAEELDLGRERAELVRETAKLHDIGMVYVPAAVLRKPHDQLTDEERDMLASHIEAGARLAVGAGIPEAVGEWILRTRERWDGRGPEGLTAEAIPIESRIVRVACAADLMVGSAGVEATVTALRAARGSELDPRVVGHVARALN